MLLRWIIPLFLAVLFAAPRHSLAQPQSSDADIFEKLKNLNTLRQALASSLDNRTAPVDEDTFKQTCMPVGKELVRWAQEYGYQASQISHKNRNPQNAVPEQDLNVYNLFLSDPGKQEHTATQLSDPALRSYYRRIPYANSCRHCHGDKESRPDFVRTKYPKDAAFDFQEGDLRGLYVVRKRVESPKAVGAD